MEDNRRKHVRLSSDRRFTPFLCSFRPDNGGGPSIVMVLDLSVGGVGYAADSPPPKGTVCVIDASGSRSAAAKLIHGQRITCTWADTVRGRGGCEFDIPVAKDFETLVSLVAGEAG